MPLFASPSRRISYLEAGAGPTVVLVHSTGAGAQLWQRVMRRLSTRFRVLAPDRPGYGDSSPLPHAGKLALADELEPLIDLVAAQPGPVHLVGHSYGGLLALHLAVQRPELLGRLALLEPGAMGLLEAQRDPEAFAELSRWRSEPRQGPWLARFVDYFGGPGAFAALPPRAQDELQRLSPRIFLEGGLMLHDQLGLAELRTLAMPAVVVHGSASPPLYQRLARLIAHAIAGSQLKVVPHAGHALPQTHPDEVSAIVAAHLLGPEERPGA